METAQDFYDQSLSSFRSGDLTQAIAKAKQALALNPEFPDVLEALGIFYSKADRLDEAIETMKRLTQISPNHIMAHTNLSRFYVQKGMILEAEQEQAEARRLSWKAELKAQKVGPEAKKKTPQEETEERQRDLKSRMERYQKVIQLDPSDVLGYFSLGSTYLEAKRLEEARETFGKAIVVNPNHSPSYFNLGLSLESLGQKEEAIKIYEKGFQVADACGDMIPLRKMEARLKMLKNS